MLQLAWRNALGPQREGALLNWGRGWPLPQGGAELPICFRAQLG